MFDLLRLDDMAHLLAYGDPSVIRVERSEAGIRVFTDSLSTTLEGPPELELFVKSVRACDDQALLNRIWWAIRPPAMVGVFPDSTLKAEEAKQKVLQRFSSS